jgi:hypothetical protein
VVAAGNDADPGVGVVLVSRTGQSCGLALLALLMVVCAGAAAAQSIFDRNANITVQNRPRPEYDALGLHLGGGFMMYPKVTFGETFDDNIMDLPETDELDVLVPQLPEPQRSGYMQYTDVLRPLSDARLSIAPSVTIRSNWNQNSFVLTADGAFDESALYSNFSATYPEPVQTVFQNTAQYGVSAAGTLDVYHDLKINLSAQYGHRALPRTFDGYIIVGSVPTKLNVTATISPLYVNETQAEVEVVKDFSRFRITGRAEYIDDIYPDGFGATFRFDNISPENQPDPAKTTLVAGPIGQSFHNHQSVSEFLRGDYGITPDLAVFVEQTFTETEYPFILYRNRLDSETLVGVNFQIPSLITAEIAIGNLYSKVYYAGIKPIDTPDFRADITYFATPLIDVNFSASQYIVDSGLPASPNFLDRNFKLQANYELLRNLILTAEGEINLEYYRIVYRRQQIYQEGVGATYLLNRGMRANLAFSHRQLVSQGINEIARQFNEFTENRLMLTFTFLH